MLFRTHAIQESMRGEFIIVLKEKAVNLFLESYLILSIVKIYY